jgi:hypothetical protein
VSVLCQNRPTPAGHALCDLRKCFKNNVEVGGIEPPSFNAFVGLLRAQPVRRSRVTNTHRQKKVTPAQKMSSTALKRDRKVSPARWRWRPARRAETGPPSQLFRLRAQRCRWRLFFCFQLFNVDLETTARFSHIDYQSRNQAPPWNYSTNPTRRNPSSTSKRNCFLSSSPRYPGSNNGRSRPQTPPGLTNSV